MIYIRRLWLIPTLIFCTFVYFLWHRWIKEDYHYGKHMSSVHLDPAKHQTEYPVTSYITLPTAAAKSIPNIQYDFSAKPETAEAKRVRLSRRDAVKENFEHAWKGYTDHAWAKDEVLPLSGGWRNSFGGWGATMVDTMDTLWMMGLKKEFEDCVKAVGQIDFSTNTESHLNVFETTIRYLGGLLAAYDISQAQYPILLKKAKELGEILYLPFDTPNHMPVARWMWSITALGGPVGTASQSTLIAELGSLTLEFTRLSELTGDAKWFDAVQRIADVMAEVQGKTLLPGLWPIVVNAKELKFDTNHFTLGGMVDSAYEYLPKQYLLLGGLNETYKSMYLHFLETAKKELLFRPLTPDNADILFSGQGIVRALSDEGTSGGFYTDLEPQGQHLACFLGGMIATGSRIFARPDDLSIARKLVDGCIWAYSSMPSGLMPEVFHIVPCHQGVTPNLGVDCTWDDEKYFEAVAIKHYDAALTASMPKVEAGKWWVKQKELVPPYTDLKDNRYMLRPEAIESIFILYRITGDASLLDAAWKMFQAIEKATRTSIAHAAVADIRAETPQQNDRMESFWLAETLKYFYLIFSEPELVSLDDWVLNTEAHPFRRPKAGEKLGSTAAHHKRAASRLERKSGGVRCDGNKQGCRTDSRKP